MIIFAIFVRLQFQVSILEIFFKSCFFIIIIIIFVIGTNHYFRITSTIPVGRLPFVSECTAWGATREPVCCLHTEFRCYWLAAEAAYWLLSSGAAATLVYNRSRSCPITGLNFSTQNKLSNTAQMSTLSIWGKTPWVENQTLEAAMHFNVP